MLSCIFTEKWKYERKFYEFRKITKNKLVEFNEFNLI